jgi:guanosine-3',5'-bis(diphosphate) 3'-pyrophosphohydrolase
VNIDALVTKVRDYDRTADTDVIARAYDFSARVHRGQKRMSGEPYLTHPLAVADIIADMRLDVPCIVTGLLHDTVEDTLTTLSEIDDTFGGEVAQLVDGVTKISRMESEDREAAEAETIRKIILASAKDVRVLLIKLADRAHNLRTIDHLPEERQRRMASETLDLYAPLAQRFGIYWLKSEFEENTFQVLWPSEHSDVRQKLALHKLEREGYIEEIGNLITKRLAEAGLEAVVTGRTKSAYSIYAKMRKQDLHYDDVYDVVAFRVVVDADRDCYDALGIVHQAWRPIPGRFRDYVALPKANMYQSLHTTLIGEYGERMEVQFRTHEMNRVADFGIAAHWRYKAGDADDSAEAERFGWLQQVLEWQQHLDDARQFVHKVKEDLFADDIVCFTPKGQGRTLTKGATALDFAYRIHTEVGDHCTAARVNGQLVPLRYQLQAGDTVEIITTEEQRPAREWLKIVKTPRARHRIMGAIKTADRARAVALGRELLDRDLVFKQHDIARIHREGRMADLLKHFERDDEDALLEAIGYGRIRTKQVVEHLFPESHPVEPSRRRAALGKIMKLLERQKKALPAVRVTGDDDSMVRLGKCCDPLPGEGIVGFMTRGRGVTVHSTECERLADSDDERRVEVVWEKGARTARDVRIEVVSRDRPGLLAGMSHAIAQTGMNIHKAYVRTTGEGRAVNVFEMTLFSEADYDRVCRNLRRVPGVKDIRRLRT